MIKEITCLLITFAFSAGICANTSASPKHLGNKIELMFFQHAGSGQILVESGNPPCYKLLLNKLDEQVIYISDQPARVTGSFTIPQFVETWHHNEQINHIKPNAILHAKNQHGRWINDTAVFSNLQYDAKHQTLTYTLCPLDKDKGLSAGKFKAISIFIDPFHPWPP
jgi:hypothetical protein